MGILLVIACTFLLKFLTPQNWWWSKKLTLESETWLMILSGKHSEVSLKNEYTLLIQKLHFDQIHSGQPSQADIINILEEWAEERYTQALWEIDKFAAIYPLIELISLAALIMSFLWSPLQLFIDFIKL